jgi:hypothetical protein
MATNAVIALTPEALNTLFPEGSTARVELQRASLDLAARHFAKHALGDEAKDFLRSVIAEESRANTQAVHDTLRAHFGDHATGMGRNRFVLTQDIKDRIKEATHLEVSTIVRTAISAAVAEQSARLTEIAAQSAKRAVYEILKSEVVATTQRELDARAAALKDGLNKVDA